MPDSILSPLDRVPAPFDPKDLRKSTIAIPLWNAIEQELAQTKGFLKQFPDVLKDHNAAVFHRKQFPGGLDESRRIALERLQEAVAELKETTSQTIDPYDPATRLPEEVSLAKLDGRVLRELLAIDRGETESAIERIWPSLFDVTIDINLDFKPTAEEMQQHQTSAWQSVPATAAGQSDPNEAQTEDTGPANQVGGAQAFGGFFSKAANAVINLMNLSTYFEMKQRAGTVGKNGVAPLIDHCRVRCSTFISWDTVLEDAL